MYRDGGCRRRVAAEDVDADAVCERLAQRVDVEGLAAPTLVVLHLSPRMHMHMYMQMQMHTQMHMHMHMYMHMHMHTHTLVVLHLCHRARCSALRGVRSTRHAHTRGGGRWAYHEAVGVVRAPV